jgi:uncharacterized membrane protein YgcG
MKKGTPNEIFRSEFQELVSEKYNDYAKIYTDGSKKEEKLGYGVDGVVTDQQSTHRRIRDQLSIFSAEEEAIEAIEAIIDAIQKLPHPETTTRKIR